MESDIWYTFIKISVAVTIIALAALVINIIFWIGVIIVLAGVP